jgi:hypothetical protein
MKSGNLPGRFIVPLPSSLIAAGTHKILRRNWSQLVAYVVGCDCGCGSELCSLEDSMHVHQTTRRHWHGVSPWHLASPDIFAAPATLAFSFTTHQTSTKRRANASRRAISDYHYFVVLGGTPILGVSLLELPG